MGKRISLKSRVNVSAPEVFAIPAILSSLVVLLVNNPVIIASFF
jgi:hypothetical protein